MAVIGLPYLVVRVISDEADQHARLDFNGSLDRLGGRLARLIDTILHDRAALAMIVAAGPRPPTAREAHVPTARAEMGKGPTGTDRMETDPTTTGSPQDEPVIRLRRWKSTWSEDDPHANFKSEVMMYGLLDPLVTLRGLSTEVGIPVDALARYVRARWATSGSGGLLELGFDELDVEVEVVEGLTDSGGRSDVGGRLGRGGELDGHGNLPELGYGGSSGAFPGL